MIVNRELSALRREYNKKNIFLYFSCHLSPSLKAEENINTPIDFTFLDFDYVLSTRNMFEFFKNRLNQINHFKKIGLLSTVNINEEDSLKINNLLKSEKDKKIIAIFDNSFGPQTWYTEDDYLSLIFFIDKISQNSNLKIILKTKTNLEVIKKRKYNNNVYSKLVELLKNKNICMPMIMV